MFTAHIEVIGDPSVGIPHETYIVEHLAFVDEEHKAHSINVLRNAFREISGNDRVRVNLLPE